MVIANNLKSFIDDPGIQLTHSKKENILMGDIFVFPEMINPYGEKINSRELLKIDSISNKILLSGAEDSGKTSLVKTLIKHYFDTGYFPVYIDIQNYEVSDLRNIIELINIEYEKAYAADSDTYIEIENKERNVVFIENVDKLSVSPNFISEALAKVIETHDYIFITESTQINTATKSEFSSHCAEMNFSCYKIMEFSADLRLELIEKWYNLGQSGESDSEKIKSRVNSSVEVIDKVIENNLVPSYPLYLLTILQMDNQEEEITSGSSYGQYYEYLINKSLQNLAGKDNINSYLDFLSTISYIYVLQPTKYDIKRGN